MATYLTNSERLVEIQEKLRASGIDLVPGLTLVTDNGQTDNGENVPFSIGHVDPVSSTNLQSHHASFGESNKPPALCVPLSPAAHEGTIYER
jgi:hypothetical protein